MSEKNAPTLQPVFIQHKEIDRVEVYKYLGTIFDTTLKFKQNTEIILKKVHQRMFVLRKLNSFSVKKPILHTFYNTFIERVLSFSFLCWFSALSLKHKNRLQSIVKSCSEITGVSLRNLT